MDPKSLRYFLAVAEELHYGRAAERLCMSQPPLTKHIQQLEARLGVMLFDRNKRGVRLTPAGSAMVREARRLLAQTERSMRAVQLAEHGDIGRVRIGFVAAVLFMGVESVFRRIELDLKGVDSVWEEMGSSEQMEALHQDRIDLGFSQISQGLGEMACHRVASVPLAVALPDTHRLAQQPEIRLADLVDDAFIVIPRESAPTFHDLTVAACVKAGFSPNIRHYAKHLVSIVSLVAMGRGVSLVPQTFARAALPGVVLRPIAGIKTHAEYSVVWNPRNTLPVLGRVLELLGAPRAAGGAGDV
jgi:DNA-binding transcriptional LysR family regulator